MISIVAKSEDFVILEYLTSYESIVLYQDNVYYSLLLDLEDNYRLLDIDMLLSLQSEFRSSFFYVGKIRDHVRELKLNKLGI